MCAKQSHFPEQLTDFIHKMINLKAFRFIVSGRVQGVGFRWFVLNEATKLGINGTVKNLVDGSVEVFAQAEIDLIYKFKEVLEKGTSFSRVEKVLQTEDVLNNHIKEFKVIY